MTTGRTLGLVTVPRRSWLALIAGSISIFLFVFDSGLLSVALPVIEEEFSSTPRATISWAATGYLVAFSALLLASGRIADRKGRKRIYIIGLIGFAAAAVVVTATSSVTGLIIGRVLQGAAGAFMTGSALALVLPEFPPERHHTAIGLWGTVGSLAAVLAPTGGALRSNG